MKDTICAIATLVGDSSINVIRVSGDDSINIVNNIFDKNLLNKQSHTITYGFIYDKDEKIDEVLVSIFRSPKSFTTEDVVEINSHGGKICVNKIIELLLNNGCRLAEPGEFLKRAFLNGRIDLLEAEAVADMISSRTDSARKMSMKGISKELSNRINDLRSNILTLIANIEVNIDYPEYEDAIIITRELIKEKLVYIKDKIRELLDSSKNGILIKNGINISIVGKPNVGKSSILNELIGEDKAIVTDIKGTTRDIVEGSTILNGIEVIFFDTAGIRKTTEVVESIGIEKSIKKIKESDLILFVLDSSIEFDKEDKEVLDLIKDKNVLIVYNKTDIGNFKNTILNNYDYIEINTKEKDKIKILKDKIIEIFNLSDIEKSDYTYISNARQISLLKKCLEVIEDIDNEIKSEIPIDLIEINIKLLWETLGEITGQVYKDELLDEIFSKFCLGK
ncbi:MAG: tRNA uridine-5-carboxymethylaminomethyl(34) synthesis GTPase MnmE [bacterium]|nr:tRNA uridine-5-carboxymethylaminomethyl(34) synthesis GTPase MnmE [bacterium]